MLFLRQRLVSSLFRRPSNFIHFYNGCVFIRTRRDEGVLTFSCLFSGLRNAFQDETISAQGEGGDKEVVLITLKRPLIYIQPMAVDKAILVWLNYKNAYEYWNEQRSNLTKEVLTATQQVFDKMALNQLTNQMTSPHLGTLFLQLTVEDMGICVPLNPLPMV